MGGGEGSRGGEKSWGLVVSGQPGEAAMDAPGVVEHASGFSKPPARKKVVIDTDPGIGTQHFPSGGTKFGNPSVGGLVPMLVAFLELVTPPQCCLSICRVLVFFSVVGPFCGIQFRERPHLMPLRNL